MTTAQALYEALNGVFCIYKPPQQNVQRVIRTLQHRIASDLNYLPYRPPRQNVRYIEGRKLVDVGNVPEVTTMPDLADHPLVVGSRYEVEDIDIAAVNKLPAVASGVMVMTIGAGRRYIKSLREAQHMKVYHVTGRLGIATDDFSLTGRLVEKTTFRHVKRYHIDKVVAAMQAGHHKNMFHAAGVDVQSQEAYEMVSKGLLRPLQADSTGPAIFGMKCIHCFPPEFVIEVHAMNEKGVYLRKLVHNMGLEMKSSASCQLIRRIRDGRFDLIHALLWKHWDAQSIADNIAFCRPILARDNIKRTPMFEKVENERVALLEASEDEDEEFYLEQ